MQLCGDVDEFFASQLQLSTDNPAVVEGNNELSVVRSCFLPFLAVPMSRVRLEVAAGVDSPTFFIAARCFIAYYGFSYRYFIGKVNIAP